MKTQFPQYYRRSVIAACAVEDNELLTVQQGYEMGESIEGYCLDAPDVVPAGSARRYNDFCVRFVSRAR